MISKPTLPNRTPHAPAYESLEARLAFAVGATTPYTTYEVENGTYTGTLLGPSYAAYSVAGESSGRKGVELAGTGQYAQITAAAAANGVVVRYSIPDTADGGGQDATLGLYVNGTLARRLDLTSRLSHQYGDSNSATALDNNPARGFHRNYYDEVRVKDLTIRAGDTVRLQKDATDTASAYDLDLIDLENIAAPLTQPPGSINVRSAPYNAVGDGVADDTLAIRNAIAAANGQ